MAVYSPTHIFALIPAGFADSQQQKKILKDLFGLNQSVTVYATSVPQYNSILLYAWEADKQEYLAPSSEVQPTIVKYLSELHHIEEHNKLIMDFDAERKQTCLLLAEGDKLIAANSYRTIDFPTAIYYMIELLDKSQINPQQTTVNLIGMAEEKELAMLKSYVKGIKFRR